MFDVYASALVRNYRAPIPKLTPRICTLFPTSTMALNPPPLKLCDCANLALNDINKFTKGQGYAVQSAAKLASSQRSREVLSTQSSLPLPQAVFNLDNLVPFIHTNWNSTAARTITCLVYSMVRNDRVYRESRVPQRTA